jgi:hypothetical protein
MDDVRQTMSPLLIGRQKKLHWREETKAGRRMAITTPRNGRGAPCFFP